MFGASLAAGSETTCERPNQEAQWLRGPNAGVAVQVRGSLSAPRPVQVEPSAIRGWQLELKPRAGPDDQLTESTGR